MEFNSIHHFFSKSSSLPSHPLLSTIVTLYTLILIYAPSFFLTIVLSPVLNSTGIILLFLLKLGANERLAKDSNCLEPRILDHKQHEQLASLEQTLQESHQMNAEFEHDLAPESNSQDDYYKGGTRMEMELKQMDTSTTIKFLEWNMKAPLEIIYEAYEGEEEDAHDDNDNDMVSSHKHVSGFERYPSLSMYYPESETDSSSDDDFPMNKCWETHESVFFKWEKEDDDLEELIEISLDRYEKKNIEICRSEEDNLIEIDIFQTRN